MQTKSIYEKISSSDGTRVLVSRYYPRGVKKSHFDLWIRGASPEPKLLKEYKNDAINWREFARRFRKQLGSSPASKEAINELARLSCNGRITLLCYEKAGERCHREIVRRFIERKIRWIQR